MAGIFGGNISQGQGGLRGGMQGPGPRQFAGQQAGAFDQRDMMGDMRNMITWNRDDLENRQQDAQRRDYMRNEALGSAPPDPYKQTMQGARAAADAGTYMKGQQFRDMMQQKSDLDAMTPFNIAGGTNTQWRNMPAASAMTGLNLPGSGWETYAALAGAAPGADPLRQQQASALQQAQGFQGGGLDPQQAQQMYPGMWQRMYGQQPAKQDQPTYKGP
ncbi:MAG: hypothetical protein GY906_24800 [bacterium]|nr:hypothetical protein [bacterium]